MVLGSCDCNGRHSVRWPVLWGYPAGHKAATRGCADRVLHMALVEARTLGSEAIEMGRLRQRMAIARESIGTHFVGIHLDNIHRVSFGLLPLGPDHRKAVGDMRPHQSANGHRMRPRDLVALQHYVHVYMHSRCTGLSAPLWEILPLR